MNPNIARKILSGSCAYCARHESRGHACWRVFFWYQVYALFWQFTTRLPGWRLLRFRDWWFQRTARLVTYLNEKRYPGIADLEVALVDPTKLFT